MTGLLQTLMVHCVDVWVNLYINLLPQSLEEKDLR